MTSCELREQTLKVPASLVMKSQGLAVDVGVSTAKVIYTPKAEWERLQKDKTGSHGELRLLTCARNDLSKAASRVSKDGHVSAGGDGRPATLTFTGCSNPQVAAKISNQLKVNVSSEPENDCLTEGLRFLLQNYTYADLVTPHNPEIIAEVTAEFEKQMAQFREFQKHTSLTFGIIEGEEEEVVVEKPDPMKSTVPMAEFLGDEVFPLTVFKCGSVLELFTIKDASYTRGVSTVVPYGGQSLLGLASFLCGTTSYDALIDLAEKGNEFAVNTSSRAFGKEKVVDDDGQEEESEDGHDIYSRIMDEGKERIAFGLGNAVGKTIGDFRAEDLAAAIVANTVRMGLQNLAQHLKTNSPRAVLVVGDLMARAYVRDLFTKEWMPLAKSLVLMGKLTDTPEAYFMKHGGDVGALGALLHTMDTTPPAQAT